jgi:hypothetical protein
MSVDEDDGGVDNVGNKIDSLCEVALKLCENPGALGETIVPRLELWTEEKLGLSVESAEVIVATGIEGVRDK